MDKSNLFMQQAKPSSLIPVKIAAKEEEKKGADMREHMMAKLIFEEEDPFHGVDFKELDALIAHMNGAEAYWYSVNEVRHRGLQIISTVP